MVYTSQAPRDMVPRRSRGTISRVRGKYEPSDLVHGKYTDYINLLIYPPQNRNAGPERQLNNQIIQLKNY